MGQLAPAPLVGRFGHRHALWAFVAGLLLLQAGWIFAVPAFRGIDEIDHTYRAASVVRDQAAPRSEPVPWGRGNAVRVPPDLVESALPACEQLKYVGRGNCHPVTVPDDSGLVVIATAASQYLPAYYAAVGWPSLFVDGAAGQYGMRLVSALLCDLVLVLAASIAVRRSPWLAAGVMACLTPTVLYATVTVAPNGLSMVAGLLMWVAWASMDPNRPRPHNRRLLYIGAAAASVSCLTHNTSPIWVLITIAVIAFLAPRALWATLGVRAVASSLMSIFVAMLVALVWTLAAGANQTDGEWHPPTAAPQPVQVVMLPVRWLFQSVFGAPRPGGMTSGIVYGLAFLVILLLCAGGFVHGRRQVRVAMAMLVLVLLVLPLGLTWLTYADLGFAWQGRYSIPLGVGITVLAARALHGKPFLPVHLLGMAALGVVAVGSLVSAVSNVVAEGAQFLVPTWAPPILGALGVTIWTVSLALAARRTEREHAGLGDASEPTTHPVIGADSASASLASTR